MPIVAYEADAFPAEYRGTLLVTSWGDHRIDRFRAHPQGTSLTSKAEPLIIGGENFRPVGLAQAPDGSLFATDWVLKDYSVHGHGRIWRIAPKAADARRKVDDLAAVPHLAIPELRSKLASPRLDIRRLAARTLADRDSSFLKTVAHDRNSPTRLRLEASWALQRPSLHNGSHAPAHSTLKNREIPLLWPDLERPNSDLTANGLLDELQHPSAINPSIELWRLISEFDKFAAREPKFVEKVAALDDRFVFAALVQALTDRFPPAEFAERLRPTRTPSPRLRLALLLAATEQSQSSREPGTRSGPRGPRIQRAAHGDPVGRRRAINSFPTLYRATAFRFRLNSRPFRGRACVSGDARPGQARSEERILRRGLCAAAGTRRTGD